MGGSIGRADIPWLCRLARARLRAHAAAEVVCDVGALADPDVVVVDALARLQLAARRLGRQIRLGNAGTRLQELLALLGLSEVLPMSGGLPLEPRGQAEEGEQTWGVEEEADRADPSA